MNWRVRALANLRHYLPDAREETVISADRQLNVAEIRDLAGIPRGEIMTVHIDGQVVDDAHQPADNATLEFFPILSGG